MGAKNALSHPISACPVCSARRFRYLFSIEEHRLVQCTDCRFTLLNPQPSNNKLAAIYGKNYFLGTGREDKESTYGRLKIRTADLYLERLAEYGGIRRGRLLEIGCGSGAMLIAAARRGFEVTGVEYSEHACETARQRLANLGLKGEVICGEIDAVAHRIGEFDACVMADVIEHVRDPRYCLQVLHGTLRMGGVMFIATPSLDSWSAKMMSTRWMEFKPEHLSYFSRSSLEGLLFAEGYRSLAWEQGYKILNYEYIEEHFEKFRIPLFTQAVKAFGACLPSSSKLRERQILASGMIVMGRRAEKPERPRLSIIIPVFNEAETVRPALTRLLAHPMPRVEVDFIVVESNSTDGTREIVGEFALCPNVQIIYEDRPRGKGYAVRTGLAAARGDFVAIQDADLEYDVDDYDSLLEPLIANREAFVLGARHGGRAWKMRQFAGQPVTSLLLNFGHWFFTTLLNVSFSVWLKDPFTMYKIFRRDCIHDLSLECNRFDFDWELVIKLIRLGYVPTEIPVNYRSRSFREGKKVSVFRDPLTWMNALIRFRLSRVSRSMPSKEETAIGELKETQGVAEQSAESAR